MKISFRRILLSLFALLPITSVSYAAAIAKGRENSNEDASNAELNTKEGDEDGDQDTDGNTSMHG